MKILIPCLLLLFGCNPKQADVTQEKEEEERIIRPRISYLQTGEQIAMIARAELVRNLTRAIKSGGSAHAVEFCNLRISPIIDSLSEVHHADISRLSLNNRNIGNAPDTEMERTQMDIYASLKERQQYLSDTLYNMEERAVYFKPIILTNQLCLRCHGGKRHIDTVTQQKIKELYPEDKATGYQLGDFRGAWKVEFEKPE